MSDYKVFISKSRRSDGSPYWVVEWGINWHKTRAGSRETEEEAEVLAQQVRENLKK